MDHATDTFFPMAQLAAGSRVLDLGCGSGTVNYAQYPHVQFVGVDQYAHTESGGWPPNARLVLGEAERLPFRDGSFQGAVCNFVFEHFADPRLALRGLARVVCSGGFLYVSVPCAGSIEDRLYRFTLKGGGHVQRYTFQSVLETVYAETGFKLDTFAPSPAGFTWLRGVPWGDAIRSLLYRGFHWLHRATGRNSLVSANFLLLFRREEQPGLVTIEQVCSKCGNPFGSTPPVTNGRWRCPACAFENVLV